MALFFDWLSYAFHFLLAFVQAYPWMPLIVVLPLIGNAMGDALERRFGKAGALLHLLFLCSPFIGLGYLLFLEAPMMLLKVVLISALFGALLVALWVWLETDGKASDWLKVFREFHLLDYVIAAFCIVMFGFFGLVAVSYVLMGMGLGWMDLH